MNLTAQDLLEIRNLITTYSVSTDDKDVKSFMNCRVDPEDYEGYDSGSFGYMKIES